MITTIKVTTETKTLIDEFKIHKRQSYDEVINEIIKLAGNKDE